MLPQQQALVQQGHQTLLNRKKTAFMERDTEDAKKGLQKELRRAKDGYKKRIEGKMQRNNASEVVGWVRSITGMKSSEGTVEGTKGISTGLTDQRRTNLPPLPQMSPFTPCLPPPPQAPRGTTRLGNDSHNPPLLNNRQHNNRTYRNSSHTQEDSMVVDFQCSKRPPHP